MGPNWVIAMAELLSAVAWPVVALFVVIKYKSHVGRLIDRLRKGGPAEFDPLPVPQASTPDTSTAAALADGAPGPGALDVFSTEATRRMETFVRNLPFLASLTEPEEKVEAMVTLTARIMLIARFESVESNIWASQVALLEYLNSQAEGVEADVLRTTYYEEGANRYPILYQNYSFEGYMNFLERNDLAEAAGSRWRITLQGYEYLQWRIAQRKPPRPGG